MIKGILEKKLLKKVHSEKVGVTGEVRNTYLTLLPTVDEAYITVENMQKVSWRRLIKRDVSVQRQPILVTQTIMPLLHLVSEGKGLENYRDKALKDFNKKYEGAKEVISSNRDLTKGDKATFLEELDKEKESAEFNFGELEKEEKELLKSFKDFEFLGRYREGTILRKAYFALESPEMVAIYEVVYLFVEDKDMNIISSADTIILNKEAIKAVVEELDKELKTKLEKETK